MVLGRLFLHHLPSVMTSPQHEGGSSQSVVEGRGWEGVEGERFIDPLLVLVRLFDCGGEEGR